MALASLSHGNTFSSSSSSLFTSKFPNLLNPNFSQNLRECTNSVLRCGNKHKFHHFDSSRVSRDRKTTTVPAASLGGLLSGIFKGGADTGESTRQQYSATVALINSLESELVSVSDSVLREKTDQLKQRARQSPQSLDSLLPVSASCALAVTVYMYCAQWINSFYICLQEAFAIVREASKRVLGLRPFDVQLIGKYMI